MKNFKNFYEEISFNQDEDNKLFIKNIRNSNQIIEFGDLHKLLINKFIFNSSNKVKSIIEFGCGTGWLSNSLSYYYKKKF